MWQMTLNNLGALHYDKLKTSLLKQKQKEYLPEALETIGITKVISICQPTNLPA